MRAMRYISFFFVMCCLINTQQLCSTQYTANGRSVDTSGDEDVDVMVSYNPGWVTDRLRERGIWTGNDDLDDLSKNLRIVTQIVSPENEDPGLSSKEMRKIIQRILGEEVFKTDVKYTPDNMLPFLHASIVVVPSGVTYSVSCTVRLVEDVTVKRNSWAKDFMWQAITWEREELFISRRGRLSSDAGAALARILDNFTKQYLSDIALRKEIDTEQKAIEKETEKDKRILQEQLKDVRKGIDSLSPETVK